MYLVLKNGLIGKLKGVCQCEKCLERGSPELEVTDLDGEFLDSIRLDSIHEEDILYFGKSIQRAVDVHIAYILDNQKSSKFMNEFLNFVEKQ